MGHFYCIACGSYSKCPDIVQDSAIFCRKCNEILIALNEEVGGD